MIPISNQGFERALKNIREAKKLLDDGDYVMAKKRVADAEGILMANRDNKMPKPKIIWNDERFD